MSRIIFPEHRKFRIVSTLLRWYKHHGRRLPWRNETNPYRVLISEVMLQQTQVSRVLTKYPEFLKEFSSFQSLARARTDTVIRRWRGMGYNNRALRLKTLSRIVVSEFGGKLPDEIAALLKLPGVGRYTAHAVACFAFSQNVPVVDTNIARILKRLFPPRKGASAIRLNDIWTLAAQILPRSNAHDWNQALMDLGATICTAALPVCNTCPLASLCPSAGKRVRKVNRESRREPGRRGIPNRIYRGRTIEVLRNLRPGQSMDASLVAQQVLTSYSKRDRSWFSALLKGLARDGLLQMDSRSKISLPE